MPVEVLQTKSQVRTCKLHWKKINVEVDMGKLSEVFGAFDSASILGGNLASRFNYWAAEAIDFFEFNAKQDKPFEKLQEALDKYKLDTDSKFELIEGLFTGGWIGYFSYELGRYIEKIPATTEDDLKMPLIRLCFYDRVICYDSVGKTCLIFVLELPGDNQRPGEKLAELEKLLSSNREIKIKTLLKKYCPVKIDSSQFETNISKDYYLKSFKEIKRNIYDGNVYQINFSIRFQERYSAKPIELFNWQNLHNGCDYSGYINSGDFTIVSTSPEMFITIKNGIISTKPIKGTRPRCLDEKLNRRNFKELLESDKEQAELNMIIDLERNDLGRICKAGTIKVVQPRTIEEYPTVFHAAATVQGALKEDVDFCDILKAMFPGGSITGAPKISSMKIIDRFEPTQRAVYTGSIGYIGIDGNVCLNIAIRTIIISGGCAYVQVGSGIVADSDAESEWNESLIKAEALLTGIKSIQEKSL